MNTPLLGRVIALKYAPDKRFPNWGIPGYRDYCNFPWCENPYNLSSDGKKFIELAPFVVWGRSVSRSRAASYGGSRISVTGRLGFLADQHSSYTIGFDNYTAYYSFAASGSGGGEFVMTGISPRSTEPDSEDQATQLASTHRWNPFLDDYSRMGKSQSVFISNVHANQPDDWWTKGAASFPLYALGGGPFGSLARRGLGHTVSYGGRLIQASRASHAIGTNATNYGVPVLTNPTRTIVNMPQTMDFVVHATGQMLSRGVASLNQLANINAYNIAQSLAAVGGTVYGGSFVGGYVYGAVGGNYYGFPALGESGLSDGIGISNPLNFFIMGDTIGRGRPFP